MPARSTRWCRLALVAAMISPAALAAQQMMGGRPKHEFGVDIVAQYFKESGSDGEFVVGTPVDVRIGFVSSGALSFEPRFTFGFASGGGASAYSFAPDLNVLWRLGDGSGAHHLMGPYATAGAGVNVFHFSSSGSGGSSDTEHQVVFNLGLGLRRAFGSGALRTEAFFGHGLKSGSVIDGNFFAASNTIGVRFGLSLWH